MPWPARSPAAAISMKKFQTEENEAQRDDENFCHVAAWEYKGGGRSDPGFHKEKLKFENVKLTQRSYK
jgi:succinate dehydrogenase / fumarate reductase flavoprotein subunit